MAEKETSHIQNINEMIPEEDFLVSIASPVDDGITIITGTEDIQTRIQKQVDNMLLSALEKYDPSKALSGAFLTDNVADTATLTLERLSELAKNPQSDLKSTLEIIDIVRRYTNENVFLGRAYESIVSNINTTIRLSYSRMTFDGKKQKEKKLVKAEEIIKNFNDKINLENVVRSFVSLTWFEGNCALYLRNDKENYIVDRYPLGVVAVSEYSSIYGPMLMIDIKELEKRLKKTQLKDKKGKPLFFKDIAEEIEKNYPNEVYEAYKNKERYAILDPLRARIMRINNYDRKYGLSGLFRSLRPTLMLESFAKADSITAKAIAKKVIFQKMRRELLGSNGDRRAFEDQAYAHNNLVKAFGQSTVLVTTPPAVESIQYIEPKVEMISKDTVSMYRNQVMIALGINFWDNETQTVTSAKISINQLLLLINTISSQLEKILESWYKLILSENGIEEAFAPKVTIIDSEMLEMDLKLELSKFMYSTLNLPREDVFSVLDISLDDAIAKRMKENELGLDNIFTAYSTSYTKSSDEENKVGRTPANNPDKKNEYDKNYNDDARST